MAVRRRSDNHNWLVDFRVGGKRIRETYPASLGRREVEALERKRRQEVEAGGASPSDTWGALAARWWQEHGQHLTWRRSLKVHLNALGDALGDATPAATITTDDLARAVARWRKDLSPQTNKPLSPQTINHRVGIARSVLGRAAEVWGERAPAIAWRRLRLRVADRNPPYVSPAERARIIACAPPHIALAIEFAAATGWRRCSVLALRWEDVDFARGLVRSRGKGKALVSPLTDALRQLLVAAGPAPSGPVVSWRGKPVGDIKIAFATARLAAGLPRVRFADIRHSTAQEVLAVSGSLDLVAEVLAHSTPGLVKKHYARIKLDTVRAALEARDRALSAQGAA